MKFLPLKLAVPKRPAGFEQIEGADDVGGDEITRPGDGTIHVRFRREVHDVRDGVLLNDPQCRSLVAQIHLLENEFRMTGRLFQIFLPPGVSQAIQVDKSFDLWTVNDVMDEIGADEAGAASDDQFHGLSKTCRRLASQSGSRNPKVFCNLPQSKTEYAGRFAGVGYSAAVIFSTTRHFFSVSGINSIMREANSCQFVWPLAAR